MSDSTCYRYVNGEPKDQSINMLPCGVTNSTNPQVPCCSYRHTCLNEGICYFPESGVGVSGYFAAGCTDSKFGQGCRILCKDNEVQDIVYKDGYWYCCTPKPGGKTDCDNPTEERFKGPPPDDLITIVVLPPQGSGTPTYPTAQASSSESATYESLSSTSNSSNTSTPTSTQSSSGQGLNSGASAGIGVGATAGLVFLVLVGFLLHRWRRNRKRVQTAIHAENHKSGAISSRDQTYPQELETPLQELEGHQIFRELEEQQKSQELEGKQRYRDSAQQITR